jgi:membrane-bound lytic murein transglycosylase MltF
MSLEFRLRQIEAKLDLACCVIEETSANQVKLAYTVKALTANKSIQHLIWAIDQYTTLTSAILDFLAQTPESPAKQVLLEKYNAYLGESAVYRAQHFGQQMEQYKKAKANAVANSTLDNVRKHSND